MRFVKGFNLGGSQLSLYLDARNILNFTNTLHAVRGDEQHHSPLEQEQNFTADSDRYAQRSGLANGVFDDDRRASTSRSAARPTAPGLRRWVDQGNDPSVPNCVYLIAGRAALRQR